jgi:hypothetical protein
LADEVVTEKSKGKSSKIKKHRLDARIGSVEEAYNAVDNLIESMDLDDSSLFLPKVNYNPAIYNIPRNVTYRALGNGYEIIKPELFNPVITDFIQKSVDLLKTQFKLVQVPEKVKKYRKPHWDRYPVTSEDVAQAAAAAKALDYESGPITTLNSLNPVEDFKTIVKQGNRDLIVNCIF